MSVVAAFQLAFSTFLDYGALGVQHDKPQVDVARKPCLRTGKTREGMCRLAIGRQCVPVSAALSGCGESIWC